MREPWAGAAVSDRPGTGAGAGVVPGSMLMSSNLPGTAHRYPMRLYPMQLYPVRAADAERR